MIVPPLVRRALALAGELGLEPSCTEEAGRLLHVLAAGRGRTRVAEIGARCGVGSAWIVSALEPSVPFFTVEPDERRAVDGLFGEDPNVHALRGDWRPALPEHAPFDLVVYYADAEQPAGLRGSEPQTDFERDSELVLGLLAPRGTVVVVGAPRDAREFWLGHPSLAATEILVSPRETAIVAVRAL